MLHAKQTAQAHWQALAFGDVHCAVAAPLPPTSLRSLRLGSFSRARDCLSSTRRSRFRRRSSSSFSAAHWAASSAWQIQRSQHQSSILKAGDWAFFPQPWR